MTANFFLLYLVYQLTWNFNVIKLASLISTTCSLTKILCNTLTVAGFHTHPFEHYYEHWLVDVANNRVKASLWWRHGKWVDWGVSGMKCNMTIEIMNLHYLCQVEVDSYFALVELSRTMWSLSTSKVASRWNVRLECDSSATRVRLESGFPLSGEFELYQFSNNFEWKWIFEVLSPAVFIVWMASAATWRLTLWDQRRTYAV